ncbi:MAG: OadG family transporter subunit [Bacteroidales bacterium]|nr:OadG family transporter subunit [Bacteroidales bacterium]MDD3273052.1 OadG family transporter subunit [Bacteroidales bacterium]MDD4058525.1 OadG family transporter subunit [Bacteroidales bacterium]
MKRLLKIFLLSGLMLAGIQLNGQSQSDMCINEYLVYNTDDFVDDFGHKSGWVELFNTSYGTVNIGGCYLTNDPNNLTKYIIPKGDVLTKIKPRQHILFWADNQPHRGTFHLNFKIEESDEILLVASDGRTIIDKIQIKKDLDTNVSYGRFEDGIGSKDGSEGWQIMSRTSPSTNNSGANKESASAVFKRIDPYGVIMAMTAMSVVFLSLILLYVVFKNIGKYNVRKNMERAEKSHGKKAAKAEEDTSAEIYAAIAAAMHLYTMDDESHDIENTILTIAKVTKNYSPWSSKIYTLRETPCKK